MTLIQRVQQTTNSLGVVEKAVVTYTDGLTETITDPTRIAQINEQLKAQQQQRQFLTE